MLYTEIIFTHALTDEFDFESQLNDVVGELYFTKLDRDTFLFFLLATESTHLLIIQIQEASLHWVFK